MKKIIPLLIAVAVVVAFAIGYSGLKDNAIAKDQNKIIYHNTDTRNSCIEAMSELLNDKSILLLGSSELSASDNIGYPPALFNQGNSDFNIIMMGRGYMQSLHHAISVAALADKIVNKKVVLIISPQWFTKGHLSGEAYASRFSERLYAEMVKNAKLTYKTKRKIADRVESLLEIGNPDEYKRVLLYNDVYIEKNISPAAVLQLSIWDSITNAKQKKDLLNNVSELQVNTREEKIISNDIDYKMLLYEAEQAGINACANNDLYINDDYYTAYVKDAYESSKDSQTTLSYLESLEYDDFELFLTVCYETGISPLIVSVPVNGIWYDWIGFPNEDRQAYYQKIRDVCQAHEVSMLDFSEKEFEHYFLKDIMHMGWKGWVYLDEAVYRYYLDNGIYIDYPFFVKGYIEKKDGCSEIQIGNMLSDIQTADLHYGEYKIGLTLSKDGYLRGETDIDTTALLTGELIAHGEHGAGLRCMVYFGKNEELFSGANQEMSAGVTKDTADTYTISTSVEGNRFNAVVFQVFDKDMKHLENINIMKDTGDVSGIYRNESDAGYYTFIIKGNSNQADEGIASRVYLNNEDEVHYQYTVDRISDKNIEVTNINIWHTAFETDGISDGQD